MADKSAVEQLMNVTGSDEKTARNLLEACDGNVQLAIEMHLESSENSLQDRTSQTQGESSAATPVADQSSSGCTENGDEDNVRAPIPQQRGVLVMDPYHAVPLPKVSKRKTPGSVFDGFRDFKAEARKQEELLNSDGGDLVSSKARTLQDLFRPPVDITFKGTFEMAKRAGAEERKWLLVNIQNVTEFSCQTLNRDVWSNSVTRAILKDHFILWQVYCDSDEGQRYMLYYNVKRYPYISVVDPQTGECLVAWETCERMDAQKFCDLATQFLSVHKDFDQPDPDFSDVLPAKKKARSDSLMDAPEDSQLAAAIAASLNESKTPASAVVEQIRDDAEDSDSSLQAFSDEESEKASSVSEQAQKTVTSSTDIVDAKSGMVSPKEDENDDSDGAKQDVNPEIFTETDDMVDIVFRLPNGKRCQEKLNSQCTIKDLKAYLSSQGFYSDKHEMVMTFPRRHLSTMEAALTIKEAGFGRQETVFVQEK